MDKTDFETGSLYRIKKYDWESPTGEIVPGRQMIRRVLTPVTAGNSNLDGEAPPPEVIQEWQKYLRVEDPETGQVHLIHPGTVEKAEIVL